MKALLWLFLVGIELFADAHIFVYHRFGDDRYPSTNTTIQELRKEFTYFKENGYEVVPLEKLVNKVKSKEKIPDNWVVLTIDDNFKSFYENALEIFKEFNYPFSMFVYVGATNKKYGDYMTWEQLRESGKYGSLEFHSYGHLHMTRTSDEKLREDFKKGLELFEKHLHIKPKFFTYPYGEFDERVKNISKEFGFEGIINQNLGAVAEFSDPYDLDRAALVGEINMPHLLRHQALEAQWIHPQIYPKDDKLKSVHVKINSKAKKANLYVSKNGWRMVPVNDGIVEIKTDLPIQGDRTRVIIGVGHKISTKLLVKD